MVHVLPDTRFLSTAVFALSALVASVIDLWRGKIPRWCVYPPLIALLALCAVSGVRVLAVALAGALCFFALLALSRKASGGLMGKGDLRFGALCGLYCGFPAAAIAAFLAALFALAAFAFRAALRRPRASIPFAPFLSAGSLLAPILYRLLIR